MLVHLVFSTKRREKLIHHDIEQELYIYMKAIARNLQSPALSIGGTEDHVHVLLVLPQTGILSSLVRNIKIGSSAWLRKKTPQFQNFSWQRGYGAFSVSCSAKPKVLEYISMQKKLHEDRSFEDEYRLILQMHEVPFNEAQLWD